MRPFFLDGPSGKLFIILHPAGFSTESRSWVLLVPPFAEELNKCRPMINRQARALAAAGHNVLIPDLFGTGDSEGSFDEADWALWKRDLDFLIHWVCEQGEARLSLWGIRTGCLLAVDVLTGLAQSRVQAIDKLILWQPVSSGETFVKQFLRLKVAATMMSGQKLSVDELLASSSQGQSLEVAGYSLCPSMIEQLSNAAMKKAVISASLAVHWLEVAASGEKPLSPAARSLVQSWQDDGVQVDARVIQGQPFWSTQEIAMAPALITETADLWHGLNRCADLPVEGLVAADSTECPLTFECQGEELIGVLHKPSKSFLSAQKDAIPKANKGVLLVVGGPQYRVGSHRQFVLLARHLACAGIPVFRFDYRGMGDSSGKLEGFDNIQDDMATALDCFQQVLPELDQFVVWGLCDAATAASFYSHGDPRIAGLVLLNPWAYSEQGEAKALLKHYYLQRLLSKSFWQKVFSGQFRPKDSLGSLSENVGRAQSASVGQTPGRNGGEHKGSLADRIQSGLSRFGGRVLIVLSGRDLTAAQFRDVIGASSKFKRLLRQKRFSVFEMAEADHTFSSVSDKRELEKATLEWLRSW